MGQNWMLLNSSTAAAAVRSDCNLWPEELPAGSVVLLSEGDALVASHDVCKMISQQQGVTVSEQQQQQQQNKIDWEQ